MYSFSIHIRKNYHIFSALIWYVQSEISPAGNSRVIASCIEYSIGWVTFPHGDIHNVSNKCLVTCLRSSSSSFLVVLSFSLFLSSIFFSFFLTASAHHFSSPLNTPQHDSLNESIMYGPGYQCDHSLPPYLCGCVEVGASLDK